jgi:lipoprotein-anchoring transpeptidase ErfK/SrfK
MFLRLATAFAVLVTGFAVPVENAAAQNYPYISGAPYGPPPYPIVPVDPDDDDEESLISPPYQTLPPPPGRQPDRAGLPYPARPDGYEPAPPGFFYPDREPAPYGHIPGRAIERSDLPVPRDGAPLRPPADVASPGPQSISPGQPSIISSLPPEDQPEVGEPKQLAPQFRRQLVEYRTKEPAGTIIIDTANTYLYLVLGNGQAMRYGIGVGREGFTWSGTERVSRMAEWPDWHPPEEMIERQPYLPRFMAGGEGNPLGARALYLGKTLFRIHGTNQPSTIGTFVSSGCVRLVNDDVSDLYERVKVGTRVVVLPGKPPATAQGQPPAVQGLPPATAAQAQQPPPVIRAR